MEKEIWKDIKNYEGLYQVSNLSRVKSLNYRNTGTEKILTQYKDYIKQVNTEITIESKDSIAS